MDEVTEQNQDIPIEVGTIEFLPLAELEPGRRVPDFSLYTAGGKTQQLSDFYGKYLLLTFYSVTSEDENPDDNFAYLKRIQDDFTGIGDFEMLDFTFGGFPLLETMAETYLSGYGVKVKQGFIDGRNYELMKTFNPQNWPRGVLMAPDGTLIAVGLKGDELYEIVSQSLANGE